jgi:hypothetical protein
MHTMEKWRSGKEHERAITFHQPYALLTAKVGGLLIDRALSAAAVHPHPTHTGLGTIAHYAFGVPGCSHYQHTIYGRIYLLHASETAPAFQFSGGWIYRDHVIALLGHQAKQHATEILRIAGQPDEGDAPLSQEVANVIKSGRHGSKPPAKTLIDRIPTLYADIRSDEGHSWKDSAGNAHTCPRATNRREKLRLLLPAHGFHSVESVK